MNDILFPSDKGLCLTCLDRDICSVKEMLPTWRKMLKEYGHGIKETKPDLWSEYSVEEPDVKNGVVTWCPMYHKRLHVKRAAYIRNDGVVATGKSHYDIISTSPNGTCKAGSVSGFIDNHDQFISREKAWQIALEAGQLRMDKIVKNGEYLLSEEIWSDRENGEWEYDEEKGYVERKN